MPYSGPSSEPDYEEISARMQEIIILADKLIDLEQAWRGKDSDVQTEQLETYVDAKRELLDKMTGLFQTGQWQAVQQADELHAAQGGLQEIVELKQHMTDRFREAMLLHDQAMMGIKQQYDRALTDLEALQQTRQYLVAHQAMRPTNTRIDISQ